MNELDHIPADGKFPSIARVTSALSMSEYANLPETERQRRRLEVLKSTGFKTVDALSRHILDYIHLTNLEGSPVKLSTLNRRFYKAAARVSLSILELIQIMASAGQVVTEAHGGSTLVMSKLFSVEQPELIAEAHSFIEDVEQRARAIQALRLQFLNNAQ